MDIFFFETEMPMSTFTTAHGDPAPAICINKDVHCYAYVRNVHIRGDSRYLSRYQVHLFDKFYDCLSTANRRFPNAVALRAALSGDHLFAQVRYQVGTMVYYWRNRQRVWDTRPHAKFTRAYIENHIKAMNNIEAHYGTPVRTT